MKLGLPDGGSRPTSTTERRSYDLLTDGFGPGYNGPLTVVVDAPKLDQVQQADLAKGVVKGLEELPGVAEVSPPATNPKGDLTIVSVTPTSGPASEATKDLVSLIRKKADAIPQSSGVEAFVTGTTALNIDTADRLGAALPKYVAVVVGLALLLLMVVFRSILVPLKAAAGFLLSIAASMGVVVWIFQDGQPQRRAQRLPGRADRVVPAGAVDRHPVRARDGLRGLPRVAHARALPALRPRTRVDHHRLRPERPRRGRRGGDHGRRLRRLRPRPRSGPQVDRPLARGRDPGRRLRGAPDARAGRDGTARAPRVAAAAPARALRAVDRRRGRAPASAGADETRTTDQHTPTHRRVAAHPRRRSCSSPSSSRS